MQTTAALDNLHQDSIILEGSLSVIWEVVGNLHLSDLSRDVPYKTTVSKLVMMLTRSLDLGSCCVCILSKTEHELGISFDLVQPCTKKKSSVFRSIDPLGNFAEGVNAKANYMNTSELEAVGHFCGCGRVDK